MTRERGAPTIQDVAKAAGVSVSTVSRVLNDKDDVAPTTYARVRGIIDEMGYASSLAARSLRSRRTNVIGLIMPDVGAAFSIEIMKGVNEAIAKLDQSLIIYTKGNVRENATVEQERRFVNLLNGSIADGVILVTPIATSYATTAPVVAIDPNNKAPAFPAIVSTNYQGALAAMNHLLELGHHRIGHITGRTELTSAVDRIAGYKNSLIEANISLDPSLLVEGDYTVKTGYRCTGSLLSLPKPPTAIFAANDQSAMGAIEAIQDAGLHVPHDISIVGFDNVLEAGFSTPGLTTIDQSLFDMGYKATEMLFDLIEGNRLETELYKVPTKLIIRGSSASIKNIGR